MEVKHAVVLRSISEKLNGVFHPLGFECHEFKIGWYNEQVDQKFQLQYDYNTLTFVILSLPKMFESAFKPFIKTKQYDGIKDPIDECCAHYFQKACKALPDYDIDVIHDFELQFSRRARILVQSAGHVAGAAYYYQKKNIKTGPWLDNQKIYGVSIHPDYGGWFALRGILLFKNIICHDIPPKIPPDVLHSEEKKILLLNLFNFHWRDWTYRDIIPVKERYSEEQIKYFSTEPSERWSLLGIEKKDT